MSDGRRFNGRYKRGLTPDERFWNKVLRTHGCWEWQAAKDNHGYGIFALSRSENTRAHIYMMWITTGQPVPDGHCIDHLCRNRGCVNPDHLEIVTFAVNTRRGIAPGARALRRAQCSLGHDFETWGVWSANRRLCRLCRAAYMGAYSSARREGRWPIDIDQAAAVRDYMAKGLHIGLLLKPAPEVPESHHGESIPEIGIAS